MVAFCLLHPVTSPAGLPGSDLLRLSHLHQLMRSSHASGTSTLLFRSIIHRCPYPSLPLPLYPISLPDCLFLSPSSPPSASNVFPHLYLTQNTFQFYHRFLPSQFSVLPLPPTNPSPPCFSFLITIPIPFPGSGVRTGPCGPSAPPSCPLFSALLGFCPVCRLPLQFVFFKLHHPRFFASFLLPAFVNSSQRGRSLGLAFEASRIVLLIILGNNPSFSFLLERACTPPPRALRLSSQANKRKFCSVL